MEAVSRGRRNAAVLSLALGGFAVGLTEFVAMGLLPEMAQGLLPDRYAHSTSDAVATTGWTITAYALGVVVGAPVIAALTARMARKKLVLGLLALFAAGTVASAVAPTFPLVLLARFVAALPHGAYFGAAGMVAAALIGPGSQAKGFAAVLSGLTAANIFGVPLITGLGQATSWRWAYLAIAGMFVLTLLAVLATVPPIAAAPGGSPRRELEAFRTPQVWMAAAVASIGFAGFFAVYSYIAPITVHVAGLSPSAVPWVLATIGLGMTVGNLVGGALGDRNLRRSILLGLGAVVVTAALFALVARYPVGLFVTAFAVGAACLVNAPTLQARLIAVAPRAQLMGAAINQSATNVANSLGAALGGLVIAWGFGYTSPAWVGAGLALAGLTLAVLSFRLDARRPTDKSEPTAVPAPVA
ncbi:MFS transporter [Cryptosporangium aurantiacum]|uniref:MFS transporter, DHA1 family, inner membrane transport protein n=1 Tax=Cryptosporangium aurantiacum TaxID=134849 RepID=A0A1M7KWS0_9ACTN|nr:MFS transporter [Cryptosporangium aurantiacum]SHM69524.1 MFS transporter, DHA1 family, inner membrane transport protein [Cryptosporangium aurantiacum]